MHLQIRINKTFLKELSLLPTKQREVIEKFVFQEIQRFDRPSDIPGFKKLHGYDHYFRIRFGNFRAGLRIENGILTFERLLHRKDIYKYYP